MSHEKPLISVAIPARNDRRRLERTLQSIAASSVELDRIEVVVADDGSTDGTYEAVSRQSYPYRLDVVRGEWSSQSAATNAAIRQCRGTWVLLTAQDILFHEDLIAEHLRWHRRFEGDELAVLGQLAYPRELEVTPFLFYLVNGGLQFAYYLIKDPLRVPPNFVYAPNFSARRSTLERIGLFDEQLPYGCQDTDLGIRLSRVGVRITYNERALGFHDHPTDLESFSRRQEKVAAGKVRLQRKHPDHEPEHPCWDVVLANYLSYSAPRHDLDLEQIAALEREVARHSDYRKLWTRGWILGEDPGRFTDGERRTLEVVDRLFNAYTRILQFHWGKGYLEEALRGVGFPRVREVLAARLSKIQGSAQTLRLVHDRLTRHDLPGLSPDCALYSSTRIVHGVETYADALRLVEPYQWPRAARFAQQLLLVVELGKLSEDELVKLDEAAEVVTCRDVDDGVLQALRLARAEIVTVSSANVVFDEARSTMLAERIFERVADAVALSGGIQDSGSRKIRYGYCFSDSAESPAEPLLCLPAEANAPRPVDAGIPEYMVLRRSAVEPELERELEGNRWSLELCRRLARRGGKILHLPEYVATRVDSPAQPRSLAGAIE